jgi:hypothetical protein
MHQRVTVQVIAVWVAQENSADGGHNRLPYNRRQFLILRIHLTLAHCKQVDTNAQAREMAC